MDKLSVWLLEILKILRRKYKYMNYPINPNWWGTFPMVVFTFLESFDFSGKRIIPFCTHEGSGLGKSVQDIRKSCRGALVENGFAINGGAVTKADKVILRDTPWLV